MILIKILDLHPAPMFWDRLDLSSEGASHLNQTHTAIALVDSLGTSIVGVNIGSSRRLIRDSSWHSSCCIFVTHHKGETRKLVKPAEG